MRSGLGGACLAIIGLKPALSSSLAPSGIPLLSTVESPATIRPRRLLRGAEYTSSALHASSGQCHERTSGDSLTSKGWTDDLLTAILAIALHCIAQLGRRG